MAAGAFLATLSTPAIAHDQLTFSPYFDYLTNQALIYILMSYHGLRILLYS